MKTHIWHRNARKEIVINVRSIIYEELTRWQEKKGATRKCERREVRRMVMSHKISLLKRKRQRIWRAKNILKCGKSSNIWRWKWSRPEILNNYDNAGQSSGERRLKARGNDASARNDEWRKLNAIMLTAKSRGEAGMPYAWCEADVASMPNNESEEKLVCAQ